MKARRKGREAVPEAVSVAPPPVEPPPAPAQSVEEKLALLIRKWAPRPTLFVRECIGGKPDVWQDMVLRALEQALETGDPRFFKIALKACKGPGKTCVLAWIILWFLVCYRQANILVTSITFENLKDGLWKELALWIGRSDLLKALLEQDSERLYVRGYKETWFVSARTWPKDADKAKQADTLAGLHAKHTMIVIDESGGVPVGVLVAALAHHSTQDPNSKEVHFTLQAGNPTAVTGALGWACTSDASNWWIYEITGDPDRPDRASRIDIVWAREQIAKFGRDSSFVKVNVLGEFPPVGVNKLLGPEDIRAAQRRIPVRQSWDRYPRVMALDVARSVSRDRSVLVRRQGTVIFPMRIYRLEDSVELAGQVAFEFSRWPAQMIIVDADGIGGPVADQLRAIGLPVIMFHGGLPARDPQRYFNRRTEVWCAAADRIKRDLALPDLSDIVQDMSEPEVEFTAKGQIKLESKEHMLKRGVGSPDLGDAIAMSFAEPTMADVGIATSVINAVRSSMEYRQGMEFTKFEED